jgi:hypothetical protein
MKCSAFNMIPKANDKFYNGNSQHLHDPRELTCQHHRWRLCLSRYSVSRVLFTLNSSTRPVNQAYYTGLLKLLREAVRNFVPTFGFCNMTMLRLTWRPLSNSFWPKRRLLKYYTHCCPDLVPNDFWLFPQIKSVLKGQRFQDTEDIQRKVTTSSLKAVPQQVKVM